MLPNAVMFMLAAGDGEHHAFDARDHIKDADKYELLTGPWGHIEMPLGWFSNLFGGHFKFSLTCMFLVIISVITWLIVRKVAKDREANTHQAPHGLANAIEAWIVWVRDTIVYPNLGPTSGRKLLPFFLSLFLFLLVANYIGLVPGSYTVTAQLSMTMPLALITLILTFFGGFLVHGIKFIPHMVPISLKLEPMIIIMAPIWIFLAVLEFAMMVVKSGVLMIRLQANMMAGHLVILSLLYMPFKMESFAWGGLGLLFATGIFFLEILVCFLQAYVFTLLSAIFIGHSLNVDHHH